MDEFWSQVPKAATILHNRYIMRLHKYTPFVLRKFKAANLRGGQDILVKSALKHKSLR